MNELETLKTVHLFAGMDDQEIAGVRSIMELNHFVPGQGIVHENEESEAFHVIIVGTVEFLATDADGAELILDQASVGGFFGELSALTGEPRLVRVRAVDEVTSLSLSRKEFHNFVMAHPHAGIDVMTALAHQLYRADKFLKQSVSRNLNEVSDERLTIGERIADQFASGMGSWPFIIIQSGILAFWVVFNVIAVHFGWWSWDPYPFIFLNLVLSFQAAYAAPIIMMSQNRSADKDRLAAEIDHQVNVKAEVKTGLIMSRLDDLERAMHFLHKEQCSLISPGTGNSRST
jgi:CRP/FNR family transcriptional regulator, cyclic AMP receptor protein